MSRSATDREIPIAGETAHAADISADDAAMPLLTGNITSDLQARWNNIQTSFVDEPRKAVEQADALVADAMKHLADSFADTRARLEKSWSSGGDVSTEDLRVALRRYRAFFGRLIEV